jgi:hypothetical protein
LRSSSRWQPLTPLGRALENPKRLNGVEADHVGQNEQFDHIHTLATSTLNPRQPLLRLVKGGDNVLLR